MAYVYNYDNSLQQLSQVPELNSIPHSSLINDPSKKGLMYKDPNTYVPNVSQTYPMRNNSSFMDQVIKELPVNVQDAIYEGQSELSDTFGPVFDSLSNIGPALSSGLSSLGSSLSDGLKSVMTGGSQASVYNSYDFSGLANAFKGFAETLGTTAAEANALSQQSALDAMRFSASEAEKNRAFQQMIYNQSSAFNASEAQKNREWQEYMSNTSYQRAVKDLRAAGLNPILAYNHGGASSGSGATASIGTLSGSQGSGYTANFKSDASAQDLFVNILQMLVGGITSLIGTGVGALTRILK